jgi:MraZ protein
MSCKRLKLLVVKSGKKCTVVVNLCPNLDCNMNLQGEYVVSIDPKGRVRLPAGLLRQLGATTTESGDFTPIPFVINHWFEGRLMLWPQESWEEVARVVRKLNPFHPKQRNLQRLFLRGSLPINTDSAGRILINKKLLEYAKIETELMLSCQFTRIEISPSSVMDEPIDASLYEALGQEVFGGNNASLVNENPRVDLNNLFADEDDKDPFAGLF